VTETSTDKGKPGIVLAAEFRTSVLLKFTAPVRVSGVLGDDVYHITLLICDAFNLKAG
jgi:hypothetical protein